MSAFQVPLTTCADCHGHGGSAVFCRKHQSLSDALLIHVHWARVCSCERHFMVSIRACSIGWQVYAYHGGSRRQDANFLASCDVVRHLQRREYRMMPQDFVENGSRIFRLLISCRAPYNCNLQLKFWTLCVSCCRRASCCMELLRGIE